MVLKFKLHNKSVRWNHQYADIIVDGLETSEVIKSQISLKQGFNVFFGGGGDECQNGIRFILF
jgi:hypothetical protein